MTAADDVRLRDVVEDDLPILFEQQRDPESNRVAGFVGANPGDRDAFMAKWARIRGGDEFPVKAILHDGVLVGSILCWRDPELPGPEVTYWIAREQWGKGIATRALSQFLEHVRERPLYGRCAADNVGSLRVLEKCGFAQIGRDRAYANARGEEIDELILELRG